MLELLSLFFWAAFLKTQNKVKKTAEWRGRAETCRVAEDGVQQLPERNGCWLRGWGRRPWPSLWMINNSLSYMLENVTANRQQHTGVTEHCAGVLV